MEVVNSRDITRVDNFTGVSILCPICGILFNAFESKTNICIQCLQNSTDLSQEISKTGVINYCRMCHRFQRPPWVYCDRQSKECMAICLKKIKGLNKVNLKDASFIWTEEHSRRLKIQLKVSKELQNSTVVNQNFLVEFMENYMQCDDCKAEFTPHTWTACVQVRQKVNHKKTFYYIEQVLLKHGMHDKMLKVEQKDDGVDFFFKNKTHANKLVNFLEDLLPVRKKQSFQLISHDDRSNCFVYKYSFAMEIPKICRYDLIVLTKAMQKQLGGVSNILLCYKVSSSIHLVDPFTFKRIDLNYQQYFSVEPHLTIVNFRGNEITFQVNEVELKNPINQSQMNNKSFLSSATNMFMDKVGAVDLIRTSDWQEFPYVRTHLAGSLRFGNQVIGYDLRTISQLDETSFPQDIILIKKAVKKQERRIWKLKNFRSDGVQVEVDEKGNKKQKDDGFDDFIEDIEGDRKLQKDINLYRNEDVIKKMTKSQLKKFNKQNKKPTGRKIFKLKGQEEKQKSKFIYKGQSSDEGESLDDEAVKLASLLNDINLNDNNQELKENDEIVDKFIQALDQIKIEK